MIPFDPINPNIPLRYPLKVIRTSPITKKTDNKDLEVFDRRKARDRRRQPFKHRGPFEMRKGKDRRAGSYIDEQV